MRALVGIKYDDMDQDTYEGVEVLVNKEKEKVFNTGDPVKDWKDAHLWLADRGDITLLLCRSSCDHFVMDGDKYRYKEVEGFSVLIKNEEAEDAGS